MSLSGIDVLRASVPVMPVIEIPSLDCALPLAEALSAGGIQTLEITLRSDDALAAIELLATRCPGLLIGAGTVTNVHQYQQAVNAGAKFAISPGLTSQMLVLAGGEIPLIPGVMTPSDVLVALNAGFTAMKLFPASIVGPAFTAAMFGPFPEVVFCPTGGISRDNMRRYLGLPNVLCVGGSWLAPRALIADKNWAEIRRLAEQLNN